MSAPSRPGRDFVVANLQTTLARLLPNLIHEVNNALQAIGGHAELLSGDADVTATTRRRADTISSVVARTAALLAEVQAFAREARTPGVIALAPLLERALRFRRYSLGRGPIDVSAAVEDGLTMFGDEQRVLQVVLNALMHVEHSLAEPATGHLQLRARASGDRVVIELEHDAPRAARPPAAEGDAGIDAAAVLVRDLGGELLHDTARPGRVLITISLPATQQRSSFLT